MSRTRTLCGIMLLSALVTACAGQPRSVQKQTAKQPVVAYLPSPESLRKPSPPPPPPFKAGSLLNLPPEKVEALLGKTDLVRQEGDMLLWRYKGLAASEADKSKACPLLVFFGTSATGARHVVHVDSPAGSPDTCADALRLKMH